jgi:Spy/CpxP family protein refolding chaperone
VVNRTKYKGVVILVGVFGLGALAGGAGVHAWVHREWARDLADDPAQGFEGRRLRALTRQLDLTPAQRDQIRDIWMRKRGERARLMQRATETCAAPLQQHKAEVEAEIRAVLTPDQARRFDDLLAKQRERFPLFGPPPGHGPPF